MRVHQFGPAQVVVLILCSYSLCLPALSEECTENCAADEDEVTLLNLKQHSASVHAHAASATHLIGGWCAAAWAHKCTWGSNANIICPGGFQRDASIVPTNSQNWLSSGGPYEKVFLTVGGYGVVDNAEVCTDVTFLSNAAKKISATGIAFDMEGCLEASKVDMSVLADTIKALQTHHSLEAMLVPMASSPSTYDKLKVAKYVAPMLYAGDSTYDSQDCAATMKLAAGWVSAGWPTSKTFLTFQSKSASSPAGQKVLPCLAGKVVSEGYLGMLGWPVGPTAQPSIDQANLKIIKTVLSKA